ncbi:MAG: archease [Acidobacteriota bacterium]
MSDDGEEPGHEGHEGAAGHREIDHTADLGFEVWGPDLSSAFIEATRALMEVCTDRGATRAREDRSLEVAGDDPEELLVRWLHEVYLQLEIEGWLTADVESLGVGDETVRGTLRGEVYDPDRHTLHTEIKAITYHEMKIERGDDGLVRTTVVLDV